MTAAQARVREALTRLCYDGWPATVREVAGLSELAPSTAHHHLEALERIGYAKRHPRNEKGGWRP
jgi:DNA-binding IclR family transcriptional regulator